MRPIHSSYDSTQPRPAMAVTVGTILIYLLSEKSFDWMGGDTGAFLYTTNHFVVMPMISACLVVFQAVHIPPHTPPKKMGWFFISLIPPISIALLAFTGSPMMFQFLNINFNR